MGNLKKTIWAGVWNFLERMSNQILRFVLNLILARILFPSDYGLIGMIYIFIAISDSFIEGGFISAIIQKNNRSQNDLTVVFYFNVILSILIYFFLFLISPLISKFYQEPILTSALRALGITIIFNSFSVVPKAIINLELNFKIQAYASIISSSISGIIAIILALRGLGVWALIWQSLILAFLNSGLIFLFVNWQPSRTIHLRNLKNLFVFGSRLLIVNLMDRTIRNIYLIFIGKFFSANQLGLYTRAEQFTQLPATNLGGIIHNLGFPILCKHSNNNLLLKLRFTNMIKIASLIGAPIFSFIAFFASQIISITLTDKWIDAAVYLSFFSIIGYLYTINFLGTSLILAKNLTRIYLKNEIAKKIILVLVILITYSFGIIPILIGQIIVSLISILINIRSINKILIYSPLKQFSDSFLMLILSSTITSIFFYSTSFVENELIRTSIGFIFSMFFYFIILYFFNIYNLKVKIENYRINP